MLKLHSLFGDHMVLQKGNSSVISGLSNPGQSVKITLSGMSKEVRVDKNGRWKLELSDLEYGGPHSLDVVNRDDWISIKDIYVGEVWLCSGQSNMDQRVASLGFHWCGVHNERREIFAANHPLIRCYSVRLQLSGEPCSFLADESTQFVDINAPPYFGKWVICSRETAGYLSAAAYFFARDLQRALSVPIGIITSCYGASTAQAWIGRNCLQSKAELEFLLREYEAQCFDYDSGASSQEDQTRLAEWQVLECRHRAQGIPMPRNIVRSSRNKKNPRVDQHSPTLLYNGMIAPLYPFAISGVIWYHGESHRPGGDRYFLLLETLIHNWRELFSGDATFLIVQNASVNERGSDPVGPGRLPYIREAQLKALSIPKVGVIVTIDIGEINVHPRNKQEVGRRLALAARAVQYQDNVKYSGPVFKDMEIIGGKIKLSFIHNDGLHFSSSDNSFAIASADGVFKWADARIEGNAVIVQNRAMPHPKAVRYGWAENPPVVLFNRYRLPASPFRTDLDEK